eukprot:gene7856-12327_t
MKEVEELKDDKYTWNLKRIDKTKRPKIGILSTGGTISCYESKSKALCASSFKVQNFMQKNYEHENIAFRSVYPCNNPSDANLETWKLISSQIKQFQNNNNLDSNLNDHHWFSISIEDKTQRRRKQFNRKFGNDQRDS